jgi:hypothetical protein
MENVGTSIFTKNTRALTFCYQYHRYRNIIALNVCSFVAVRCELQIPLRQVLSTATKNACNIAMVTSISSTFYWK